GRVECPTPLDHRRVVMRVGDGDGPKAAYLLNGFDGRVIEERDAVPEQVALWCGNENRSLADGKRRLGSDPEQTEVVAHLIPMGLAKIAERCPSLPRPADILPLVLTDRAMPWLVRSGRELNPACRADIGLRLHVGTDSHSLRETRPGAFAERARVHVVESESSDADEGEVRVLEVPGSRVQVETGRVNVHASCAGRGSVEECRRLVYPAFLENREVVRVEDVLLDGVGAAGEDGGVLAENPRVRRVHGCAEGSGSRLDGRLLAR